MNILTFRSLLPCAIGCALLLCLWPVQVRAVLPPAKAPLPNYDKRGEQSVRISQERLQAIEQLRAAVPDAKVQIDLITGSPAWVRSEHGFLSGPNGRGGAISEEALARWPQHPHWVVKAFLHTQSALFAHGAEIIDSAVVKQQFVTPHNGLKTVIWQQQLDGISVFEGLLIAHTTKSNELAGVCSHFVPELTQAADRGTPNRAALQTEPAISAAQAISIAAAETGESVPIAAVAIESSPENLTFRQHFKGPGLKGEALAQLVWLPLDSARLRLCWEVILIGRSRGEMFRVLIDCATGEPLVRHCLTSHLSNATYRVFSSDSPSPLSPGYSTPTTTQPPLVARTLLTLSALDTNASPNGWIDDGVNETRGNNVDAHTDWTGNDQPDLPRPQGSPFRVFDFPMDLSSQDPTNYSAASIVQTFYWCNWMHDKLYELGFTEAAGNFQGTNFGRGGAGNDAVVAEVQDGAGFNNADFSVSYDGFPGRMQMYLFNGPSPRRDGDLDAQVVLHEYTHGLSNRRVGGGVLISALQTGGMGEGWSDFYALSLLSEPGDDVNGTYGEGAYVSYLLGGLTQNYYFGIRRYPYCTDLAKNPLTFKDIDPAQASAHTGVPKSSIIGSSAAEVHNQGEVWCMTLWEARANLITKYGWTNGNQLILQLVTDGMNLSPANPTFLDARDAILQADLVDNNGADFPELWAAFAKRGMGFSARRPASTTTAGVHEAHDLPFDSLLILPTAGFVSGGPIGGPFYPAAETYTLVNTATNPLNWAASVTAPWLTLSPSSGILPMKNSSLTVTALVASAANALGRGNYSGTVWFTNLSSGAAFSRQAALQIGKGITVWGDNEYGQTTVPANLFDAVAIACGGYHTLALKKDGTVVGWGMNSYGQITVPAGLSNVVGIAAASGHSLAVKSDGTVAAWGDDYYTESDVPPGLTNAIGIAAGLYHSLALRADGTVIGWGSGNFVASPQDGYNYGQLIIPAGLSNVVAIAAGHVHSVALKADGKVVCWGANFYGQSTVPANLGNVMAIAANGYNTMALKKDGTIVVWGDAGLTNPPPGLAGVAAIAAGESTDLALLANGTVVAWGADLFGETDVPGDLRNVLGISAGWYHSAALVNDGTLNTPFIFKQPQSRTAPLNGGVAFSIGAVGTPPLSYRWRKDGATLNNGGNVGGADTAGLGITTLSGSDSGSYSLIVSNANGSAISSNAMLTVLDPGIVQQPVNVTNIYGTAATFRVVVSGSSPLRYYWKRNGVDLSDGGNISGSGSATLTLSPVANTDAASYSVAITNHQGYAISSVATLTVIAAPQITIQPMPRTKLPGRSVAFSVSARGAPTLTYRWLKNRTNSLADGGNVSGASTPTLTLANLSFADTADYSVIITNTWGSVTSAPAHLIVNTVLGHVLAWGDNTYGELNVPSGLANVAAISAGGYNNAALITDGTVRQWGHASYIPAGVTGVAAVAYHDPDAVVLWEDGTVSAWGLNDFGEANVPPGLSNVVAVGVGFSYAAALKADGTAVAWGSNPYHMTNDLANLGNIVAMSAGDDHVLLLKRDGTVAAVGDGYAGQTNVPPGLSNVIAVAAGGQHSLALKSDGTVVGWGQNFCGQLTPPVGLSNVVAIAAGLSSSMALKPDGTIFEWGCFDRSAADTPPSNLTGIAAISSAYSHSLALVNDNLPPAISGQPTNRIANAGNTVSFTAGVSGAAPLSYQWRKNGLNLSNGGNISGADTPTLMLFNLLKSDEGRYTLAATNTAGFAISSDANLTVIDPIITAVPLSSTNIAGTTATFTAGAAGTSPLSYQWLKNGVMLSNGGKISGANTTTLVINGVDHTDAAAYSMVVTNVAGSATSSPPAEYAVIEAPSITLQPSSRTNSVGSTATFTVAATGSLLHYQWQKDGGDLTNGVHISGANSSALSLLNLTKADAGNYHVTITNAAGSVTSQDAILTILDALFALSGPATMITTNSAVLNGTVAPGGVAAAAWFEWGTNRNYGQKTALQDAGAGRGVVRLGAPISGLARGVIVHFRVAASNATQLVYGTDQQLLCGGRVAAWGDNSSGQIGVPSNIGDVTAVSGGLTHSLALRTDGTIGGWGNNSDGQTTIPAGFPRAVGISAGGFHNLALLSDGTVRSWGRNDSGQTNVPPGLSNVVAIAAGGSHSLALLSDGSLAVWGNNAFGQATIPTGLSNAVAIAAGWYHSLALAPDGTVTGWGANNYGQATVPPGLTNVVWVGAGLYHSLVLRSDGSLVAWGYNGSGQTTIQTSFTNISAVACGGYHNLALGMNGSLPGWGYNFYGQTTVPAVATNVVTFAGGGTHSLVIIPPFPPAPQLLASASGFTNGGFRLVFTGASNVTYTVWTSTNLLTWIQLGPAQPIGSGQFQFIDPAATNRQRFYRASEP